MKKLTLVIQPSFIVPTHPVGSYLFFSVKERRFMYCEFERGGHNYVPDAKEWMHVNVMGLGTENGVTKVVIDHFHMMNYTHMIVPPPKPGSKLDWCTQVNGQQLTEILNNCGTFYMEEEQIDENIIIHLTDEPRKDQSADVHQRKNREAEKLRK